MGFTAKKSMTCHGEKEVRDFPVSCPRRDTFLLTIIRFRSVLTGKTPGRTEREVSDSNYGQWGH